MKIRKLWMLAFFAICLASSQPSFAELEYDDEGGNSPTENSEKTYEIETENAEIKTAEAMMIGLKERFEQMTRNNDYPADQISVIRDLINQLETIFEQVTLPFAQKEKRNIFFEEAVFLEDLMIQLESMHDTGLLKSPTLCKTIENSKTHLMEKGFTAPSKDSENTVVIPSTGNFQLPPKPQENSYSFSKRCLDAVMQLAFPQGRQECQSRGATLDESKGGSGLHLSIDPQTGVCHYGGSVLLVCQ